MRVLSTKKLSLAQQELILNSGIAFVDYNVIKIEFLDFLVTNWTKNVIFSSKNAVRSFLKNSRYTHTYSNLRCFCVGEKTAALIEENGLKVKKMAKNSKELANFIQNSYKNEDFTYFCGNLRRDELPSALKLAEITLFEVKTYETKLNPVKFDQKWDGILFFSPSGIQSYTLKNKINNVAVFCIGATTASEAKKHTENIHIANSTSVESVIAKAVKTLKKHE